MVVGIHSIFSLKQEYPYIHLFKYPHLNICTTSYRNSVVESKNDARLLDITQSKSMP